MTDRKEILVELLQEAKIQNLSLYIYPDEMSAIGTILERQIEIIKLLIVQETAALDAILAKARAEGKAEGIKEAAGRLLV